MRTLVFVLFLMLPISANATVIDNSTWDGNTNNGWNQSAQTISFDSDVTLNSFGWWLGDDHTHTVSIVEWSVGPGTVLYATTAAWTIGYNVIFPDVDLSAGTLYAVLFDYLGSTDSTVHYNGSLDGYADGGWWLYNTSWFAYGAGFDIPFILAFDGVESGGGGDGGETVPEPAILGLFGIGLLGLGVARRKRLKVK